MNQILQFVGPVIYVSLALAALYGIFLVLLLLRKISQKRFGRATGEEFADDVRELTQAGNYEDLVELCDSPVTGVRRAPQLILVAMENRDLPVGKLRQFLVEKFERDVLADLDYRYSWIGTISKTAPMLGLFGTVSGMILAFDKIAQASAAGTLDPSSLATEISLALFTTAAGSRSPFR